MHLSFTLINGEELDFGIFSSKFTIGRSNKCDIVIPHEGLSRQHCQIEYVEGQIFITDLGSTNGVMIDGDRIQPHIRTPFLPYLTLSFGAVSNCQIELNEKTGVKTVFAPSKNDQAAAKINSETRTVSISANPKKESKAKAVKKKEDKKKAAGNGALTPRHLVVAIILAGLIFWVLSEEETTKPTTKASPISSENQK